MATLKNIKKHPNNIIMLGCFIIKKKLRLFYKTILLTNLPTLTTNKPFVFN